MGDRLHWRDRFSRWAIYTRSGYIVGVFFDLACLPFRAAWVFVSAGAVAVWEGVWCLWDDKVHDYEILFGGER